MESRRMPRRPHQVSLSKASLELAAFTSVLAVTVAYALHRFVGVGEMPIVLSTLVVASLVGWTQPAVRSTSPRGRRPGAVVIPIRRSDGPARPTG